VLSATRLFPAPNLGQGACLAIEDAVVLAHDRQTGGWGERAGAYHRERDRALPGSRGYRAGWGQLGTVEGRRSWLRDQAYRSTPASCGSRRGCVISTATMQASWRAGRSVDRDATVLLHAPREQLDAI
jgi:hypothetical protein